MSRTTCPAVIITIISTLAIALAAPSPATAGLEPPWCGSPFPDAAGNLPDGTHAGDPAGSFPHIPYAAIRCTLEEIVAHSGGRMSLEVIGSSARGRELFLVTVNALDTVLQRHDFQAWQQVRKVALTDPARGQREMGFYGDRIKVPLLVQGAIHGDEYEGVEAILQTMDRLATTPYGADPEVDALLDHAILLFNVIQNPDGRAAGTRVNGNGFDLNRDFMTQSQPETRASVEVIQEWLPVDVLDLHGYVTPTLVEAPTKPHNPAIDYDLWLRWNQPRLDANEAALAAIGFDINRPINEWCSDGSRPVAGTCSNGEPAGPAQAQGWDDWGPFYTPMYAQHVGLNGSTVEMCNTTGTGCGLPGSTNHPRGRLGARLAQEVVVWSTVQFDVAHRVGLLTDELERYRRGVTNAPRPACCEPPFDVGNNWMTEFPAAYIIPMGDGQRSEPEANRLVDWLLFNGVVVHELKQPYALDGVLHPRGSYVVLMTQAFRGLADTALGIGADISAAIARLYAPPAAWSHGYLWGADVVTVPRDTCFAPQINRVLKASHLTGGVEPGPATAYALAIDSPTAVRTLNEIVDEGLAARMVLVPLTTAEGATMPAGSILFEADTVTTVRLASIGRANDVRFRRIDGEVAPTEAIGGKPRILVLGDSLDQDAWSLRNLGFSPGVMSTDDLDQAPGNPLAGYDVIWNSGVYPPTSKATARSRLQRFFSGRGGYIGAGLNGARFLNSGGLVSGLNPATRGGNGRSAIVNWVNDTGPTSPITGAAPARDTAIIDPPTWFTSIPASMIADGRLPDAPEEIVGSGFWLVDDQSATAPGAAVIAHGTTMTGVARVVLFAMNPLYRGDPEREWAMAGLAAYWTGR
jgi:hypothetical protein